MAPKRSSCRVLENVESPGCPCSIVVRKGRVGRSVIQLLKDLRLALSPNTAAKLKERKFAKLRDYVAVSSIWKVSHLLYFKRTENCLYFTIGKLPRGPTLVFRVGNYSLMRDISMFVSESQTPKKEFLVSPLVVLHNFTGNKPQLALLVSTFQSLFPSINPESMKLKDVRRMILFSYNKETDRIDFRHYRIKVTRPEGDKITSLFRCRDVPNLSGYKEIGDFILSETNSNRGLENEESKDQESKANIVSLVEIGPRMELIMDRVDMNLISKKPKKSKKKTATKSKGES